jgi:hypothetical protein
MRDMINICKILVRKPHGKRLLGRYRCRWEDIEMDNRETGFEGGH